MSPRVEITPSRRVYGRDTQTMMNRGVFGLLCGGVSFHLDALRGHLGQDVVFLATGGGAATFAPWFEGIELIIPFLTLEGVRHAFEMTAAA